MQMRRLLWQPRLSRLPCSGDCRRLKHISAVPDVDSRGRHGRSISTYFYGPKAFGRRATRICRYRIRRSAPAILSLRRRQ
jgi:hypothetical protein